MKTRLPKAVTLSVLLVATPLFAQTWTNTGPAGPQDCIACSADAKVFAAVGFIGGPIYTSTNSGVSWLTNVVPPGNWNAVVSSADGGVLVACSKLTYIYASTNAGVNWTSNSAPVGNGVSSLAMSADGTRVVAVGAGKFAMNSGHIYTSTDTGVTWTRAPGFADYWTSVACSADGTTFAVVSRMGTILTTTNFGSSWATSNYFSGFSWTSVASSADGSRLVAASESAGPASPGRIYTSTNSGNTWTSNSVPNAMWWSVASSADGQKLIASYQDGTSVYTSTNGGLNWTPTAVSGISTWTCASSADGGVLIEDAVNGIWTFQTVPPPQLNITPSGVSLDVSWIVPSTNFVFQQSFDMLNWQSLTNAPALNLTNLQDEVFLSPTNDNAFFRLSSQ